MAAPLVNCWTTLGTSKIWMDALFLYWFYLPELSPGEGEMHPQQRVFYFLMGHWLMIEIQQATLGRGGGESHSRPWRGDSDQMELGSALGSEYF